jgi:hypothetical protein
MKNIGIIILRFLTFTALTLISCRLGVTADRNACAEAPKKVAAPRSTMRGGPAIENLEQTGLYNSLSAAVTATRYGVAERKTGGYEAANPKQNYRIAFEPEGVEGKGSSVTGRGWLKLEVSDEAAVYPVTIDLTLAQQAKLTAGDAAQANLFGASVAIDGDTAVVGAPNDGAEAGADAGAPYVFVRSGTSWSQQAKLTGGSAQAGNIFGAAVGISGDTVVVGAPFAASVSANSGQTYVFVRSGTSWSQQAVLGGGGRRLRHCGGDQRR